MKYLFIHQNFPAQFLDISRYLAEDKKSEVLALRQVDNGVKVPGVGIVTYPLQTAPLKKQHPYLAELEPKVIRGEAVAAAARQLKAKGWVPDVIVAHPGWGEVLFIKDVFPDARLVCYCEYFYSPEGQDFNFDPEFQDNSFESLVRLKMKNNVFLQALQDADACWSPSEWQRSTFPTWAQDKISVINEGVDAGYFKPDPKAHFSIENKGVQLTADDEVITYAARSLEPARGFHVFMRALPTILQRRPNAHVVIMGREQASYGPEPDGHRSWLQKLLAEVGDQLDPRRVHIVGFLPKEHYRAVLQVSSAHVYFTYPFILSWSVLDAQAAGAPLVASDTGPLHEAIPPSGIRYLFDFFDAADLVSKLEAALDRTPKEQAADKKKVSAWLAERYGKPDSIARLAALMVTEEKKLKTVKSCPEKAAAKTKQISPVKLPAKSPTPKKTSLENNASKRKKATIAKKASSKNSLVEPNSRAKASKATEAKAEKKRVSTLKKGVA